MMILRKLASLSLIGALAITTVTACANSEEVVECDVDDQREHDTDCGYTDDNGQWIWYSWVVQGQTSYSEPGFETVESEDEGGGFSKDINKRKSKNKSGSSSSKTSGGSSFKSNTSSKTSSGNSSSGGFRSSGRR